MTRIASIPALLGLALTLSACGDDAGKGGNLEGVWEGAIVCGESGGVSLVFDVEAGDSDGEYDALGLISGLSLEQEASDVELDSVWTQPNASGPQVIGVAPTCTVVQEDGTFDMPCEGFDELGWDGANTLEASISNFLDSDLNCDLTLTR